MHTAQPFRGNAAVRYALISALLTMLPVAPSVAVTAKQKMETCKFGADDQKLQGAARQAFLTKCMTNKDEPRKPGASTPTPLANSAESGPWRFAAHPDPMHDTLNVIAATEGPNGASAVFICKPGDRSPGWIISASRLDLELGNTRNVQLRLDNAPPVTMVWRNTAGVAGAGLLGDQAVQLAKVVANAKERFVFDTGGGGTVVFSLIGASQAITQALQACGL